MINVLDSIKKTKEKFEQVTIDYIAIDKLVQETLHEDIDFKPSAFLKSTNNLEDLLQEILVFNTQTFCFWAEKDKPKWTVDNLDGSVALAYCLDKEIADNQNLLSADYLSELTLSDIKRIFLGNVEIPMINERLQLMREVGLALKETYDGAYFNMVEASNYDATTLLENLVTKMPGFNDISNYKGQDIAFYKRAQLQVKMTDDTLQIYNHKRLTNVDKLTAIADYKIPQIMREMKILNYAESLANKVDTMELLKKDSKEENEIRMSNVLAIEYLQKRLAEMGKIKNATDLDSVLWLKSQTLNKPKPYHRVYTIAY